jgi:hypothetical protein
MEPNGAKRYASEPVIFRRSWSRTETRLNVLWNSACTRVANRILSSTGRAATITRIVLDVAIWREGQC